MVVMGSIPHPEPKLFESVLLAKDKLVDQCPDVRTQGQLQKRRTTDTIVALLVVNDVAAVVVVNGVNSHNHNRNNNSNSNNNNTELRLFKNFRGNDSPVSISRPVETRSRLRTKNAQNKKIDKIFASYFDSKL